MDTTNRVGENIVIPTEFEVPVIIDEPTEEWEANRLAEHEAWLQEMGDAEKARISAVAKLKGLGLTDAEINSLIR